MRYLRVALLLPFVLGLAGCDGGSRGSGITTADGTVESIQMALLGPSHAPALGGWATTFRRWLTFEGRAEAQAGVAGIRVLIEGTSIEDETNAEGAFSLRGDFEGNVTIRFELPTTGATASIAINAPAGGVLTLDRIHIDARTGQATPQSQTVRFDGVVTSIQCAASMLQLVSSQRSQTDTDVYDVSLEGSSIRDANGLPLPCEALRSGDHMRLQGTVNDDGTFGNAQIVLQN
jgi:hypothetical protein